MIVFEEEARPGQTHSVYVVVTRILVDTSVSFRHRIKKRSNRFAVEDQLRKATPNHLRDWQFKDVEAA